MLREVVDEFVLDDGWQELLPQATVARELAAKRLGESLAARQKYEAEQAELEALRKKQAEQDRIDRERLIAEQAAEQARREEENRQRLGVKPPSTASKRPNAKPRWYSRLQSRPA